MSAEDLGDVKALVFDVLGTTFDWWTGVSGQIAAVSQRESLGWDAGDITDRWRDEFFTALEDVRSGRRAFAYPGYAARRGPRAALGRCIGDHGGGQRRTGESVASSTCLAGRI